MPSLTDDLIERQTPSLLDDLFRTAGAALLTAGGEALTGATLGLVDPREAISEYLGEEVYKAAPTWARKGAEIAGGFAPVTGALKAARAAIPGVGAVPRILQGFTAGAGLGGIREAIEGGDIEDILQGSLLEGAIFGGLEGLSLIPGMIKKRKLKDLQKLWAKAATEESPWRKTAMDEIASGPPIAEPVEEQIINLGPALKDLPMATMASRDFADKPDLLSYFKIMDEPVTVQTADRLVPGKLHSWDKKNLILEVEPGVFETFSLNEFKPKQGIQKLRLFRGHPLTHQFPRNRPLVLKKARGDARKLYNFLYSSGTMAKSDMVKLFRYVNPKATKLGELTEHELHTYTSYLNKLAARETLPDVIQEQLKVYGPAETDVRMGILSTLRPARWMFETLNKKLPWVMDRFFHPTIKAVERRNFHQLNLMDRVRNLAGGLSRKDLRKIYELDAYIAKRIRVPARTAPYLSIRASLMDTLYRDLAKTIGQTKADRLKAAHQGFREFFDELFDDLVKAGILPRKRYIKQYWPLLRDRSVVSALFQGKGGAIIPQSQLPQKVRGFMEYVRKNVIDNPETDILKLSQAYISVYTKLLHLRPAMDNMWALFKDFRVKGDVRDVMKHYMSRQLGYPSEVDYRIAATLRAGFQKIPFLKGFGEQFTTRDWLRVSVLFNNLPYYAHMGLRPFAAARNLLQPWITTGPLIGNRWLVRGVQLFTRKEGRQYIKDIGGLQESLGEYTRRLHIRPRFRDKFANFLMAMFRGSDEMNRMVSGLGMAAKFDHYYGKMGMTEEFLTKIKLRRFRDSVRSRVRDKVKVYRALEELQAHKYPKGSPAREKLEKIIEEFSHGEAYVNPAAVKKDIRDTVVKEAIGDTQWLYGKEQAPLFGYTKGFLGRQAMTYQTWWLNYLEFGKNLGRLTKAGDYAPLATALANNLLIFMALAGAGWESVKILSTIALGPFSGRVPFIEGEIPPGIDPFVKSLSAIRNVITGDFEGAEKRLETAMKKAWSNWIPGSLVWKEFARIGWAPQMTLFGERLTPKPRYQYGEWPEKVGVIFGRRKYGV